MKILVFNTFVVRNEDCAYFLGTFQECVAFVKGYHDLQDSTTGEQSEFDIERVNSATT